VGHRIRGNRRDCARAVGWEFVHAAQDDHSRLAVSRVLLDERDPSAIALLPVAADYYRSLGIQIRAILTDNGSCYRSRAFRQTCSQLGSQHRFTKPYRPRTKGKAERFIQTLLREWPTPQPTTTPPLEPPACRAGFHHYNWHRPHGRLDKSPRLSRLGSDRNNLLRIHTEGAPGLRADDVPRENCRFHPLSHRPRVSTCSGRPFTSPSPRGSPCKHFIPRGSQAVPRGGGGRSRLSPWGEGDGAGCPPGGGRSRLSPWGRGTEQAVPLGEGDRAGCPPGERGRSRLSPWGRGTEQAVPLGRGGRSRLSPLGGGGRSRLCPLGGGGRSRLSPWGEGTEQAVPVGGGDGAGCPRLKEGAEGFVFGLEGLE
jgi:hypothetical protein